MLKQLRPLSMMLALAAMLPAAQASVLTCTFDDIQLASGNSLKGVSSNCGAATPAITFGDGAFLGTSSDGFDTSNAPGYNKTQYVRGLSVSILLSNWVTVDTLNLLLAQPATGGVGVSLEVTGRGTDANGKALTKSLPNIVSGNFQEITWTLLDKSVDLTGLGGIEKLTFSSSEGVALDNLQLSLSDVPSIVPEPSLFGLTALALVAAGFAGRRRQVRAA